MAPPRIDHRMEGLIVRLRDNEKSTWTEIAKHVKLNPGTCLKIYRRVKSPKTLNKGGRPRKTDERIDRMIARKSSENPHLTAPMLKSELKVESVSSRTIQRRLCERNLHGRRPALKPWISKKNVAARLKFAKDHIDWTVENWKNVLWSDESKFNLSNNDGKGYIRRPKNHRYDPKYTVPTVKFGGGNIMVWGSFSWYGVGPLHRVHDKMDQIQYREILETVMLPYAMQNMPEGWIFMHDNDPKHTAKTVKVWIGNNNVSLLTWPAQSPDLNPIEHLWAEVERHLRGQKFSNGDDLFEAVNNIWGTLKVDLIHRLVESLPRRCKAVVDAKGFATKY